MKTDFEQLQNAIQEIMSGSGFNGKWEFAENNKNYICKNFFQTMDNDGYYDGFADFKILFPKNDFMSFKLMFCGIHSQYQNKKYNLRDYIEDCIVYVIK